MLAARSTALRRTATALSARRQRRAAARQLVTSSHKRALSKRQLEGKKGAKDVAVGSAAKPPRVAAPPTKASTSGGGGAAGGGSSTKPAAVGKAASSAAGGGGGGGALLPLLVLGGVGVGGAYYGGLIPEEYLSDILKSSDGGGIGSPPKTKEKVKVAKELKEAVEEVTKKETAAPDVALPAADPAPTTSKEEAKEEEEAVSLEHPEGGSRVDIDKIGAFYQKVNEGRAAAQQAEDEARDAAARATEYNESEDTRIDPMSATRAAADAMSELQSSASLQNSKTLRAANAAIRSDMDDEYFADLDKLTVSELRVRVVQLATEMSNRTKWEAVRLKEFLAMKEKEVGESYMQVLQKQRLEFEDLLAQRLREQEDQITRQANAALAAKEESVQSLMRATSDAREQETKEVLEGETRRIAGELELQYQQRLQNELAQMKQSYAKELAGHAKTMTDLSSTLDALEARLEVSRTYESGSRRAHAVSAAALALANKLEGSGGAAVELAALRGACGDGEGVIASAARMIPSTAEGGVPTVADLQARFDESYGVGRQAAMVPEGRAGLEGQLLGMIFAKLSVPPSADAPLPSLDDEGSGVVADGILSLARKYVQLGDLEKAVEQLDNLKGQTAYVMNDWKSKAKDRVCTERALRVIKLECALLNKDLVGSES
mmetsp:Transcript_4762/g.11980  ORF Transcript_4762/g.11980 Transcript_4762/m.11980 type:complete len:663 (+) Transcript_4762:125-2113(+)